MVTTLAATLDALGRHTDCGGGAGTHVLLLIQDRHVRVIHAATGELLRELTIDTTCDHQPTGRPPGPTRN